MEHNGFDYDSITYKLGIVSHSKTVFITHRVSNHIYAYDWYTLVHLNCIENQLTDWSWS